MIVNFQSLGIKMMTRKKPSALLNENYFLYILL